jgi:predicted transcriptional regulator
MCDLRSLLQQQQLLFTGAFAILLVIIVYLFFFSSAVYAQHRMVFVVFDSCGFEVAKAVNKLYFNNSGIIAFSQSISDIDPDSYYVVLATNISSQAEISRVLELILTRNAKYVGTSILGTKNNTISCEDLWSYCLYSDEEALKRIAEAIRIKQEHTSPPTVLPLVVGVVGLISVSAISINQSIRGRIKSILEKAWSTLVILFSILLRVRIRREDALEHPIRKAIYEKVSSEGVVPLSALAKTYSRGVLEWHISVLIRAGLLREVKVANKRFIIDVLNAQRALGRLADMDAGVECILKNINSSLSIKKISEMCSVEEWTVHTILDLAMHNRKLLCTE